MLILSDVWEFINKFKNEIKKILNYCMLKKEKNYFNPQLNIRQILTVSSLQVKNKIYSGSNNNWKIYKNYILKDIYILRVVCDETVDLSAGLGSQRRSSGLVYRVVYNCCR